MNLRKVDFAVRITLGARVLTLLSPFGLPAAAAIGLGDSAGLATTGGCYYRLSSGRRQMREHPIATHELNGDGQMLLRE